MRMRHLHQACLHRIRLLSSAHLSLLQSARSASLQKPLPSPKQLLRQPSWLQKLLLTPPWKPQSPYLPVTLRQCEFLPLTAAANHPLIMQGERLTALLVFFEQGVGISSLLHVPTHSPLFLFSLPRLAEKALQQGKALVTHHTRYNLTTMVQRRIGLE